MKRRTRSEHSMEGLPLFPVLAVLLSTVGVLCLLLLVVTREALVNDSQRRRLRAAQRAVSAARTALEVATQKRDRLAEELASLTAQLRRLEAELRDVADRAIAERERATATKARLEAVYRRIAELRARVATLEQYPRKSATEAPPGWVVTLAASPHGDLRTPLFLECRSDRVTLQPVGIELFESDFAPGPAGRSAFQIFVVSLVRALERRGVARPYPVLMVRPDGIPPFYASMHQLEAAGLQFGYELVEEEKHLQFPKLQHLSPDEVRGLLVAARVQARRSPANYPPTLPQGPPGLPGMEPTVQAESAGASSPSASTTADGPRTKLPLTTSADRSSRYRSGAEDYPAEHPRAPRAKATGNGAAPRALVLAPPHGGVWYRPVHALLTADTLYVLPRAGRSLPAPLDDERLNELLRSLKDLTAVDSRLVVLEVRPRVVCLVTPDAVLHYWRLKWHLARAGVEMEPVLITDDDARTLTSMLAHIRPLAVEGRIPSALHASLEDRLGELR